MDLKRRLAILFGLTMISGLILSGCNSGASGEGTIMHSHSSGTTSSGWYPVSVLLSDLWMDNIEGMNATVVEGSGVGNIRTVNKGVDAQSGLTYASDFADAVQEKGVFKGDKQENVMAIGALYPTWWNIAVLESSSIKTIDDFVEQGGKVIPGEPTAASSGAFERAIEAAGYSVEDINENGGEIIYGSYSDAASELKDGIIDMTVQGGTPSTVALDEIDTMNSIRLIPLSEETLQNLDESGYGYNVDEPIPANSYKNQTEEVPGVVSMGTLIVNKEMDEDVVYQMTKHLWENVERIKEEQPTRGQYFDPEEGYSSIMDPEENIHPGALRYYKEIGIAE